MNLQSEYAELECKKCKWSGKVSECPESAESLNGDEDGPHARLCPQCNTPLVVQGWIDFRAIAENAIVLDEGFVLK